MTLPDFSFEKKLWSMGHQAVGGADEVGRGCFAGPVVTSVVVFSPKLDLKALRQVTINDSKKLTPQQRQVSSEWIKENSSWSIGQASVNEINKLGIGKATNTAFRRAVYAMDNKLDYLLIDALFVSHIRGLRKKNQEAVKKGDQKSLSIAAASIVAKVYRDKLMNDLGQMKEFSHYLWHENKGYGTKKHREAIIKHGITKNHRKQFVTTFLGKNPSIAI